MLLTRSGVANDCEAISKVLHTVEDVKMKKIVKQFMEDTGYTNTCSEYHGVRKDHMGKGRKDWDFKEPSKMLEDFYKYLLKNGEVKTYVEYRREK